MFKKKARSKWRFTKAPNKLHIKKGDTVIVMRGKEAPYFKEGKKVFTKGRVIKVFPKDNRALVEGVNMMKRHTRPTQQDQQGGIIEREAPINLSNLMLEDPKSKLPTRVGYKVVEDKDGKKVKVRYAKASGEVIDK